MEDLTKQWNGLTISHREGPKFRLHNDMATFVFIIAAKFLTKRALNINAIAATFTPLWRSKNGFKIKHLGNHVVLFTFDSKIEVDNILANEPWRFDKHLMVLRRYDGVSEVQQMDFNLTPFWVQVHGIPMKFMNQTVAEGLCETVGVVQNQSNTKTEESGGFMRVRVLVDISQPLCRGKVLTLDDDKELWVSFRYERLPNICYWCGCLTHNDRDCEQWIDNEGTLDEADREFGPWIRASPMFGNRKTVVSVPGFYAKKKATITK